MLKNFFKKTKAEYRHISWLSKEDTGKQTVMVAVSTIVLGIMIAGIDFAGQWLVNLILNVRM